MRTTNDHIDALRMASDIADRRGYAKADSTFCDSMIGQLKKLQTADRRIAKLVKETARLKRAMAKHAKAVRDEFPTYSRRAATRADAMMADRRPRKRALGV